MKKSELTPMTKVILKELLSENKDWRGRTYSLYESVRGAKCEHIVFLLDEKTGFGSPISIPAMELALIDKPVVKCIMQGILGLLIKGIKKHVGKIPVNPKNYFKENPINAGKKQGVFSYTEKLKGKTIVNHYIWKHILLNNTIVTPER